LEEKLKKWVCYCTSFSRITEILHAIWIFDGKRFQGKSEILSFVFSLSLIFLKCTDLDIHFKQLDKIWRLGHGLLEFWKAESPIFIVVTLPQDVFDKASLFLSEIKPTVFNF
jgi:hypothetical protein